MIPKRLTSTPAAAGLVLASALLVNGTVDASDHNDAPAGGVEDRPVDIGDFYAWHTEDGNLVLITTFSGYSVPAVPPEFDADVLYGMHIDTDGDAVADENIYARFGQDPDGNWGVRITGIPGEADALTGALEENLHGASAARAYAGVRDDPFFFDLQGFQDTLATGTVAFDNTRDFAAAQNAAAIVVEFPLSALGDPASLQTWATTARK